MNIFVINGSPKGENSITLQTVCYLEKRYPEHHFDILHAGAKITLLEKDITPLKEKAEEADLILFAYPVYTFLAPSQLHRLIRRMKEADLKVSGKYVSQITTSKHFYDITAHRYIEDNCRDLGMKVIRGLSADMEDLLSEKGRKTADLFFRHLIWCVKKDLYEKTVADTTNGIMVADTSLEMGTIPDGRTESGCGGNQESDQNESGSRTAENGKPSVQTGRKSGRKVVIVADLAEEDHALAAMIARFRRRMPFETDLVNLHEFPFQGGCLGCFRCAADGTCIYQDGFTELLRDRIQTADAMVMAFTIRDHSMGVPFKIYDDRQFCNGHRTVTSGMPVAYLVNGRLSREENLRLLMEARANVGGNYLAGIAGNETDPADTIDRMAKNLVYAIVHHYTQSPNFYGVGGMKIFRDLIWQMRGLMREDHRFYKRQKLYDFPQKKWASSIPMYLVGAMIANPEIRKKMGNKMTEGMMAPYKKVLKNTKARRQSEE